MRVTVISVLSASWPSIAKAQGPSQIIEALKGINDVEAIGVRGKSATLKACTEALDAGRILALWGYSEGADLIVKVCNQLKMDRPEKSIDLIGLVDPTPQVWNVDDNVKEVWSPHSTRVSSTGGGKVRPQIGNGVTHFIPGMYPPPDNNLDPCPPWQARFISRVRLLASGAVQRVKPEYISGPKVPLRKSTGPRASFIKEKRK